MRAIYGKIRVWLNIAKNKNSGISLEGDQILFSARENPFYDSRVIPLPPMEG